ncbi:hypothetical protein [Novipirellula galeiformis]|uniref:hypothetical protein n=1 Tax=Novipirellula galeiformis TaxID=2528004 RepID=UPI0018CF0361|nr:hypothetical protein [Novipirellula galeiformis]
MKDARWAAADVNGERPRGRQTDDDGSTRLGPVIRWGPVIRSGPVIDRNVALDHAII